MPFFKIPLHIKKQDVLPFLGITTAPSPQEENLIDICLHEIKQKAHPVGIWKTYEIKKFEPNNIMLENCSLFLEGDNASEHFKTCEKITLLASTLGNEIDIFLQYLGQENPAHALVFDGIASAAIETFTEQMDTYLSSDIRHKGYFPTARFSPGYGDWPLKWQKEFLENIGGAEINLTTTPHFLLQPIKSVTAALGWSKIPVERSYTSTNQATKPCRNSKACKYCKLAPFCSSKKH